MSAMDIAKYIDVLGSAAIHRNGLLFSQQIALPFSAATAKDSKLTQQIIESARQTNAPAVCASKFSDSNLAFAVSNRIDAVVAMISGDLSRAYKSMLVAYNNGLDYFSNRDEEDTSWFIPVLVKMSDDLRIIAGNADTANEDSENTFLRDSLQSLTRGWTTIAKDRTPITNPTSKKLAIFAVTNVLFKIYFSLNTLSLCGKLINVVEGPSSGGVMTNMKSFPVSDVVMYKYYNGRLKMFEDKYEEARHCLRFALEHTPENESCFKNRQRILVSLIPVEMCLGVLPTELVKSKYGLTELYLIGRAIQQGDLRTFESLLEQYQRSFIKIGIYLVLEQTKVILFRNLCKRIYFITNNTRINLVSIELAFQYLGNTDVTLDEIECLLSNLIFQGKVKGYISHQKRYLVLSKTDAFPSSAIIKPYAPT